MEGRYKVLLRDTSSKDLAGHSVIRLPRDIWEKMEWKINDNLQIDTIKVGMNYSISITKEEE